MFPIHLDELPSPALLFRQSIVDQNLDRMVTIAGEAKRLRPHVKTHKCPNIIARHITRAITKFKCATIAEAEMVARNGASSVLLAKQAVGPDIARLSQLVQTYPETEFLSIVDNPATLKETAGHFHQSGRSIALLVDIDCGMGRSGIRPGNELVSLYHLLASTPGIEPGGFHVYDGHLHDPDLAIRQQGCQAAIKPVLELRTQLEADGLSVPRIIAGGSPTFAVHAQNQDIADIAELSPGTTVLWDKGYGKSFPDLPFEPAAFVMTRVISCLSPERICVDLGHKAISADKPQPRVYFPRIPDAVMETHSEEHLVIKSSGCQEFRPGDRLIGIPRHICPTVSLYDHASILSDDDEIIGRWPIEARARRLSI